ncbi:MAG TPA: hypothetical protein VHM02_11520, partial [Thermoanaerobaculia bacterium]|nr:hypothetical protein [Thermoanaerobaculia bacterium]
MSLAQVEPIADAVLFEGYLLYPYRPTALKNRHRWCFGVLACRADAEAAGGRSPWRSRSESLLVGGEETEIEVVLRFLHPVRRRVLRRTPAAAPAGRRETAAEVESLQVGDRWLEPGEEAAEVRVESGPLRLRELLREPLRRSFACAGGREVEEVPSPGAGSEVALVRERRELEGVLEIRAEAVDQGAFRLAIEVSNVSPAPSAAGADADDERARSFLSTHWLVLAREGRLVSLLDPPPELAAASGSCRNVGVWPVLVGEPDGAAVLCSPILLE